MAISLNGSTQYLTYDSAVVSGYPFTLACWFYTFNTTGAYCAVTLSRRNPIAARGYQYDGLSIRGDVAGDPVEAASYTTSATSITARTSTGYSANRWTHGCAIFESNSSRSALINGGSKVTTTTSGAPDPPDTTSIGVVRYSTGYGNDNIKETYYNGYIAEVGIWNVVLTDSEIASLARGYSPMIIRPNSLVAYYPLGGIYPQNANSIFKNPYNLTAIGSPTYVDHPNTVYPGNKNILYPLYYNNILDVIYPSNYYYMSSETNYANLSIRNDRECLTFSPTTSQSAYFTRIMPNHYSNNGCCVYLYVAAASDIKNSFSFNVSFERIGERNLDLDTNLFTSTKRRYNAAPPPTCGNIQVLKVPFSKEDMKRLKGGELYTLKVQRAVDYDTGAGNAELYAIEIRD